MKDTRSLADEIKRERKKGLEGKSFSYKFKYYAGYYKWYVVGALALILIIASIVKTMLTAKDNALCVALVGASFEPDYELFIHEFEQISGTDDKHEMTIDSNYAVLSDGEGTLDVSSQEKLFVTIAAGETDVIIAPAEAFARMAQYGYLMDLRDVLPENDIKGYEDDIYVAEVTDDPEDPSAPTYTQYSGIDISNAAKVLSERWYVSTDGPVYFGLSATSANKDNALSFLHYLEE